MAIPSFAQTLIGGPVGGMNSEQLQIIKTYMENWAPLLYIPGIPCPVLIVRGQQQGKRFLGQTRQVGEWYSDSKYVTTELTRRMAFIGDQMQRDIRQCKSPEDKRQMVDSFNLMVEGTKDRIGRMMFRGDRTANKEHFDGIDRLLMPRRLMKANDGNTYGRGPITRTKMQEAIRGVPGCNAILTTPKGYDYLENMVFGLGSGDNLLTSFKLEEVGVMIPAWRGIPIYLYYEEYTLESDLGPEDPGDGTADTEPYYFMRYAQGMDDKRGVHYRYQDEHPLMGDVGYWETYETPGKRRAWQDVAMCMGVYSPTAVVKVYGANGPS